jgi:putative ABC transport system permease protein
MTALRRKLLRDLIHLRTQLAAVTLVAASGIALFIALRSMKTHLETSQADYYAAYRFADLFVQLKRAPESMASAIALVPGVATVQTRIVDEVMLDVPGLAEPATGRLVSIPAGGAPTLNRLHLRRGTTITPGRADEVIASDAFASANGLVPGDSVGAVINGRWQTLRIVGMAMSPEYLYEVRGGELFPDNRRFGVLWMSRETLATAFDMAGAFNDATLTLAPGAVEADVIDALDRLLDRYGTLGAYGRAEQVSHTFVSSEIAQMQITSIIIPAIFLGVTAFLLHVVMARIVSTQRDQIGVLKAFGYRNGAVAAHYLGLALAPVAVGGALGIGVGLWFAGGLAAMYARFFRFPETGFEADLGILATALAIDIGAALAGALAAVHRVTTLPPSEAMRAEGPARYRRGVIDRLGLERRLTASARMTIRGVERRPYRSLLSILGSSLAVAIVIIGLYSFDAIDVMKDLQFRHVQREDIMVSFTGPRPLAATAELGRLPGVTRVEPFRVAPARLQREHRSARTAIFGLRRDGELRRIVDRDRTVYPPPHDGLLLSAHLAGTIAVAPGDTLSVELLEGTRSRYMLPVAGIVDDLLGEAAYLELERLDALLDEPRTISGAFVAADADRDSAIYQSLQRLPAVSSVGVKAAAVTGFEESIAESFRLSLVAIVGFACVIAGGVVYNNARVALSERGRELASLRILGFTRREVAAFLLGEQALLTLAALPVGSVLGFAATVLMASGFESDLFRLPLVVTARTYSTAWAVVIGAAVLSAVAVRWRLDRLDLIAVLKSRE